MSYVSLKQGFDSRGQNQALRNNANKNDVILTNYRLLNKTLYGFNVYVLFYFVL